RQPHANRSRDARPLPAGTRVGRPRPPVQPRARAQLLLVVLSQLLAAVGPGPPARPHVGLTAIGATSQGALLRRRHPHLGAAVRPCPAGDGVRALSEPLSQPSPSRRAAQAVDALRHGWPLRIGQAPLLLPVETASGGEARSN